MREKMYSIVLVALLASPGLSGERPANATSGLVLIELPLSSDTQFDLRDNTHGDRATPQICTTPDGTTVSAERVPAVQNGVAMIVTVTNGGQKKTFVLENGRGAGRYTHTCDTETNQFYVGQPATGTVFAYDATKLLSQGLVKSFLWKKTMPGFTEPDLGDDASPLYQQGKISGLTAVQAKHGQLMVEWITHGEGNYQIVFDRNGNLVDSLGPSTFMLRTNVPGPNWEFFYDGNLPLDPVNYRVNRLFTVSVAATNADDPRAAKNVLASLSHETVERSLEPITKLNSVAPVVHMVALLTPNRTAEKVAPEFCGQTPPSRAQIWLGREFDPDMAEFARVMLVALAEDLKTKGYQGDAIESWFDAEIAPHPPMRDVIATFDKRSDASYAAYQQALLEQAGPTLNAVVARFSSRSPGQAPGAVILLDGAPTKSD